MASIPTSVEERLTDVLGTDTGFSGTPRAHRQRLPRRRPCTADPPTLLLGLTLGGALLLTLLLMTLLLMTLLLMTLHRLAPPIGKTTLAVTPDPHTQRETLDAAVPSVAPYDLLPGRTAIPVPVTADTSGDLMAGELPSTGPRGNRAADGAVRLVLGRYCPAGAQATVTLTQGPGTDWTALATPWGHGGTLTIRLRWLGDRYGWLGSRAALAKCGFGG